jgi:peptide-methionine (S)-S-oxide reductase
MEYAYFGGGCFWCLEAAFRLLPGVVDVTSGYAGGSLPNPSYEQVKRGDTGHAEVVEVRYDPRMVTFKNLMAFFFMMHDPTTKDRQGNDIGSQYRSIILFQSPEEEQEARSFVKALEETGVWDKIVTNIVPLTNFWAAEEYHQHYYEKNPEAAYCQRIVRPKLEKLIGKLSMF